MNYRPHKVQEKFHGDRLNVLWRFIIGGTGSGKTEAGTGEAIYWAIRYPNSVGAIYEPTYPMLDSILIAKLDKLLGAPFERNPLVKRYNKNERMIEWRWGSQTWLKSLQEPERAEGQNLDWAWIDEARLVRHLDLALQVIGRRLRGSGSGSPVGAWLTTTPNSPGSDLWHFTEDPKNRVPSSRIYRMSIFDNPHLPGEYVEEMVRTHPGGLGKRFVEGFFADVGAGTYPFDYSVNVADPPSEFKSVIYGVDFGWTNPSVVYPIGFDGDGRAYVLDEVYRPQLTVEALAQEAKALQVRYGRGPLFCDRSEPRTIDALKRAGLDARADASKFDDGVREIGGRLIKAGDGRPRLIISLQCVNLIEELQLYDAFLPKGKQRDHGCDALRYALASAMLAPEPAFIFG
jgi:phage terminase large subunit